MKRIIPKLFYIGFALFLVGYLFKIFHWEGGDIITIVGLLTHILGIVMHLLFVNLKDERSLFQFVFLVLVYLASRHLLFGYGFEKPTTAFLLVILYASLILFNPGLGINFIPTRPKRVGGIGLVISLIAFIFKVMHLKGADYLLLIAVAIVSLIFVHLGIKVKSDSIKEIS